MAAFTFTPDYSPVKTTKAEISKVRFGDGYEQRAAKGLNPLRQAWPLNFAQREQAEADAIEAFLIARAGTEAFDFSPPDGSATIRVTCDTWTRTMEKGNRFTLAMTFEQVFEP
jgi:phage-related protein